MITGIENEGRFFKVRVGERSHLPGIYTSYTKAEKALRTYVKGVIKTQEKRKAKKDAKKTNS